MQKTFRLAVHGGAGAERANDDGCAAAAERAAQLLDSGGPAIEAVVLAVETLEDDGRFNAGSGSVLCLDGRTVEMDAAVMDSCGKLGAVACIQAVKNPVSVARALADTPHRMLVGVGATRFARAAGFEAYRSDNLSVRLRHEQLMTKLCAAPDKEEQSERRKILKRYWNYPMDWQKAVDRYGCGTVGAVAFGQHGDFAVATSTGGCAPSLLGRVGDTPLTGCGFFAGSAGAVAATGIGEHIIPKLLAFRVYSWIESGMSLEQALQRGIDLFPDEIDVGLIGVTPLTAAARSNRSMPVYVSTG